MHDVISFILGGGRGSGLHPLTKYRSVPAVSLAGKYRLIDIPISNCINSGIRRIYVLTQILSVSLHRHISSTYKFAPFSRGSVEVLAAQQTNETAVWYQGTADALRQNLRYIGEEPLAGDVLILSADGLYRMNYSCLVHKHREQQAALTIAAVGVSREQASRYGILRVDDAGRVRELVEKPTGAALDALRRPDGRWLANMGVYLARRDFLLGQLRARPNDMDLVTQHFAPVLDSHLIRAHVFDGYWQDLGTVKAYHEANLALAGESPPFDFHSHEGVIYTAMRNLPASRSHASEVRQSLLSEGCVIGAGVRLDRTVIGQRGHVGPGSVLSETVMCGSDRYDTPTDDGPPVGVGPNCVIERAILDKGCRIGANVRIRADGRPQSLDAETHVIRDGIVVIPKGTVVPDGTVI